jgi:ABC-type uncharacterized transport system substrate-binding protein
MFTPCAKAGGLVSYGLGLPATVRTCAAYVARILDAAKPDDLPLKSPPKFELVVNRTAVKMLGIKIPGSILIPESILLRVAEVRPI